MNFRDKIPKLPVQREIINCGEVDLAKIVESEFIQSDIEKKCWNLVYWSVLDSLFKETAN